MNRTDELTDRLIDGTLTDAEALELEALLAADPGARARHLALVRLELVLRGLRAEFDLAGATVARIEADRADRTAAAVMSELARSPAPVRPARRSRPLAKLLALAALAAAVVVGVWAARPAPPDGPEPAPDSVRLASASGAVEVVGPDGLPIALRNQALPPGHTLRTVGEDSVAVLEFPNRTRVEVHADSVVRLLGTDGAVARKVLLLEGSITAVATGERFVVGAGATDVEVSRGAFSLFSSGPGSARVEPAQGDVRVSRAAPAEPVFLAPGGAAFVPDDERAPVRVERAARTDARARARLAFAALDVRFAPNGDVVAASAKQWARWAPGAPDPGRTLLLPKVWNDGHIAWLAPDLNAIVVCRTDDRDECVSVRDLATGTERGRVPVRVSEPRFLCAAPDGSWVATTGAKGQNRRVRVWNAADGTERFARDVNNTAACLAASPDGRWLAVGVTDLGRGTDNSIVVVDTATGDRAFELPTKRKSITALAFSADGSALAAGFNGAVQLWDVPARRLVKTFEGFERGVTRVALAPKHPLLAAGTHDGQVWVWSADTGARRQILETGTRGVRALAFGSDGKALVTATNRADVAVWDVAPEPAKRTD